MWCQLTISLPFALSVYPLKSFKLMRLVGSPCYLCVCVLHAARVVLQESTWLLLPKMLLYFACQLCLIWSNQYMIKHNWIKVNIDSTLYDIEDNKRLSTCWKVAKFPYLLLLLFKAVLVSISTLCGVPMNWNRNCPSHCPWFLSNVWSLQFYILFVICYF